MLCIAKIAITFVPAPSQGYIFHYFCVIMKKSLVSLMLLSALGATAQNSKPLAFPGADGFGKHTPGGRGGRIIHVTNLNDSGPGSLREAIDTEGARIVVFDVSGTIRLEEPLEITKPGITIAGQSAPGDGICLAGRALLVEADNVIVRFVRSRLGNLLPTKEDAMCGSGHRDIIIDHCSMSWSVDETGSFYDNENFTMQWCILSESLRKSLHHKGNHGYGGIWGGMKASFHHNLLAHHTSRNPRFCGARYHEATAETEIVDFRNNVVYNWGNNSAYGGESGQANMVANCYKPGPATSKIPRQRIVQPWKRDNGDGLHDYGRFYIAGNVMEGSDEVTRDNWRGVDVKSSVKGSDIAPITKSQRDSILGTIRVSRPFPYEIATDQTAREAFEAVLVKAGASFRRDAIDERIIRETRTGTATYGGSYGAGSGIIDSQEDVGGWPLLRSEAPQPDTDGDGMPDAWEKAHGLNPRDPRDATQNTIDPDYNNIEVYLNSLVGHLM